MSTSDQHTGLSSCEPGYRALLKSGELAERVAQARKRMTACDLCARYCRVDRFRTLEGVACRTGAEARVASYGPDYSGEDPLRGINATGAIAFSWCNMRCVYCETSYMSWQGEGVDASARQLADMMLDMQAQGCHNINFLSPSHVVFQILEAVLIAADEGLRLPLVYNSGGYDSPEALALLKGIIDIYIPDMKYGSSEVARKYSKVENYVAVNRAAVQEMYAQVGDLALNENGIARRGLLVRHLLLPGGLADTERVLEFLARKISPNTYLNLMTEYRPRNQAMESPEIDHRPSVADLRRAQEMTVKFGLNRLETPLPAWVKVGDPVVT